MTMAAANPPLTRFQVTGRHLLIKHAPGGELNYVNGPAGTAQYQLRAIPYTEDLWCAMGSIPRCACSGQDLAPNNKVHTKTIRGTVSYNRPNTSFHFT